VYPALSVLQALADGSEAKVDADEAKQKSHFNSAPGPEPKNLVLWIGGERGMEESLVKREGIPFSAIPAAGVHGVGIRALPGNLLKLAKGFRASRQVLGQFRPQVMLFTGGYVGVPMALAASLPLKGLRRPRQLVFVPDIEPGLALKLLIRLADCVAITTAESQRYLPRRAKSVVTGYPVRAGFFKQGRVEACETFGLNPDLPVFLVVGGSKGARSINRALLGCLPQLLMEMQVIHLSGQLDWQEIEQNCQRLSPEQLSRYRAFPYLHEEMGTAYSAADLALARAGGTSLGELPFFGLPAILVPYPHAWRYQHVNAEYLESRGAAVILDDADLGEGLAPLVKSLMVDTNRRLAMSRAMQKLAHPEASRKIAKILADLEAETG
jgi:UDP-N-acetylglucosamine--N-acetylmuramyl-(pentapeptide) pyrophosphoryl-undecaprenol N-acetylglucosamine transferase